VRLCIIGKFPPIQGGVSMRTYRMAHGLAVRGHEVHVVTNAKEVEPPYRMHMRPQDWQRCEANDRPGSVTVHWTDPVDRSQSHIPMASPFVSKLAAVAARVHSQRPFDLILSFYMEPYGIAGHLAAQMAGVPHVVRLAGSDAGRLWRHPQFEALYDHVLRSAAVAIIGGTVADRAVARGVDPDRIAFDGGVTVPEAEFTPVGPKLDSRALRAEVAAEAALSDALWGDLPTQWPYFGLYGKLGDSKGSFALLAAMHDLAKAGAKIGLVALAHGTSSIETKFRARAQALGLADRVLQLPFLPHWRVPEFVRGCLAVCCLEQDFPINIHSPIIPREVLLCGTCLVASTEVIRKLPGYARLPDGYACVAVEDVNRIDLLSSRLAAIAANPAATAAVAERGRDFALDAQKHSTFPRTLEQILEAAATRRRLPAPLRRATLGAVPEADEGFVFTRLAADVLTDPTGAPRRRVPRTLAMARAVLADIESRIASGRLDLRLLAAAVNIEIEIANAEEDADANSPVGTDPLFRLRRRHWAPLAKNISALIPLRDPQLRILAFNYDVSLFLGARTIADLPAVLGPGRSYMIAFARSGGSRRTPLVVDAETAQREIRRYAEACERFLEEQMPVTHAAFAANDRTAP